MIEKEIKRLYRLGINAAIVCVVAFGVHLYTQHIHDTYRETMTLTEQFYCFLIFAGSLLVTVMSLMTIIATVCSAGVLERIQRDADRDGSCISS